MRRAPRARDLVRCSYCGVGVPQARFPEHVSADHPGLTMDPDEGLVVGIPRRFRGQLAAIRAQTGAPFGAIIADALYRILPQAKPEPGP